MRDSYLAQAIRAATPADLPALTELDEACFPSDHPDQQRAAPGELERGSARGEIRLIEVGGDIAAFAHAEWAGLDHVWLCGLGVRPDLRRRGLGSLLMDDLLASLGEAGVATVTSPRNVPMLRLLLARGFVARTVLRDHFGPGRDRLLCYLARVEDDADLERHEVPLGALTELYDLLDTGRCALRGLLVSSRGYTYRLTAGKTGKTSARSAPGHRFDAMRVDRSSGRGLAGAPPTRYPHAKHEHSVPAEGVQMRAEAVAPESGARPAGMVGEGRRMASASVRRQATEHGALRANRRGLDSSAMTVSETRECLRNDQAPWGEFDSVAYWEHNYKSLHPFDARIIRTVGEFFSKCFGDAPLPAVAHAVDVGSGSNLYPALLALPWSKRITLTDYSESNLQWLKHNASDLTGRWSWRPFWNELRELPAYSSLRSPRKALAERHDVQHVSVFELPKRQWDLGTMFFVAESITSDVGEFESATARFLESLKVGVPFAIAFMGGSEGYPVGQKEHEVQFPAVYITAEDVERFLVPRVRGLDVQWLPVSKKPERLRDGYEGMILALGRVGPD